MSDKTEDLDIVIEPDAGSREEPKVEVKNAEAAPQAEPKAADDLEAIDALKQSRDRERQGRIEAERRAAAEAEQRHKAQAETHDTNLALVTNAIETVKARQETFKAKYRAARETGDIDAETEALEEMQRCAAERSQLESGKVAMEARPKPEAPQPQPNGDPVEAIASQLSPRSAAWIRAHPDYARDERLFRRMLAAHNLAETDGVAIDSDDYFDRIETTLGLRQAEAEDSDPSAAAAKPVQRRSAPPAAPVTRSGNGDGSRPNVVRLTAEEREMAKMMGMSDQDYAKNKLDLQREGKIH